MGKKQKQPARRPYKAPAVHSEPLPSRDAHLDDEEDLADRAKRAATETTTTENAATETTTTENSNTHEKETTKKSAPASDLVEPVTTDFTETPAQHAARIQYEEKNGQRPPAVWFDLRTLLEHGAQCAMQRKIDEEIRALERMAALAAHRVQQLRAANANRAQLPGAVTALGFPSASTRLPGQS